MSVLVYILLACLLTAGTSLLLGNAVLRATHARLERREAQFLAFVLGSGLLATICMLMAAIGLARRGSYLFVSGLLIAVAVWRRAHTFPTANPIRETSLWRFAFWAIYGLFGVFYLIAALMPPGMQVGTHLESTVLMARAFGFAPGQAPMPTPSEDLSLFAFSIGRHSAAAMPSLLLLLALPLGIRAFAERTGNARPGIVAALLVFLSPAAARAGTSTAPDMMIATTAFALFYSIQAKLYPVAALLAGSLLWNVVSWIHGADGHSVGLLDLTIFGDPTSGLLGPVYVLLPLALLALTSALGRRLLLAALIGAIPFAFNPGARALLPALPFASLALTIALAEWSYTLPAILAAHVIFSWPSVVPLYVEERVWRLQELEWRAALRIEPEDHYLMRAFPTYYTGRFLERTIPDGETVLALAPFQQLYHTRRVIQDAGLRDLLYSGPPASEALQQKNIRWVLAPTEDPRTVELLAQAADRHLDVRFNLEGWVIFQTR